MFTVIYSLRIWLGESSGSTSHLEVLKCIAPSQQVFEQVLATSVREEWFPTVNELQPSPAQCIGLKIPAVFAQSAGVAQNAYVADLYEYVTFMGDLHRQLSNVPDGAKVRLIIGPEP